MPAKRILILTNRVPYPLHDGGNMATNAMIKAYQKQGWQVYLLSMNTSRHKVDATMLSGLYNDIHKFETVDVNNDISTFSVLKNLLFSKLPNHAARFMHASFANAIENAIINFNPDAIQVESVFLSGYLPAIKKVANALLLLRLHNIEWQVWRRVAEAEKNSLKKAYITNLSNRIEKYEKTVWEQYDLLIPITDTDAAIVAKTIKPTQLLTIPFGIDNNTIAPFMTEQSSWDGYHIGAMDWLPNQDAITWFITEVWPLVHNSVPAFKFSFAGRNMPQAFSSYNADGITCKGAVPDAQAFIADKKILIVPLRSGGGIRVKILEAMAAGKLVISTTVGMQGIDAETDTHFLLADTPQEFAQKIQWALQNKTKAEIIAANAAKLIAEKYNTTTLAEILSKKIMNMLADS